MVLHGSLYGKEKADRLTSCKYGIQGRDWEPFGISVAEMVKAGCITFAPATGGQAEILDHELLTFADDDQAAEKISSVLSDSTLADSLRDHLCEQAKLFSIEMFTKDMKLAVDRFADDLL